MSKWKSLSELVDGYIAAHQTKEEIRKAFTEEERCRLLTDVSLGDDVMLTLRPPSISNWDETVNVGRFVNSLSSGTRKSK